MKKIRRKIGSFLKIPLEEGVHGYGRVLDDAQYAFYNLRTSENLDTKQIAASEILFILPVMKYAINSGRWDQFAHEPLEQHLLNPPPLFIQDSANPEVFQIYEKGEIRDATREECEGLECAAAWDPEHVEDRLRDYFEGRPNKWHESLKIR